MKELPAPRQNQTDWSASIAQIKARLPELEREVLKFGAFFPMKLLPPGLFGYARCGEDCLAEIARDLDAISPHSSDALVAYWSERLSQKIHVLVHICISQQSPVKDVHQPVLESLATRTQWLQQLQAKQDRLNTQRAAIVARLEAVKTTQDLSLIHAMQSALQRVDAQLSALFQS